MKLLQAILFVSTACCSLVLADDRPLDALRAHDQAIRRILEYTEPNEEALRTLVNTIFDYEAHTRESFGHHWDQLKPSQQEHAVGLVSTLLERSTLNKIPEFRTKKIEYISETIDPDNPKGARVVTSVTRDFETWEVDYQLHRTKAGWRITDVIVEGASTIEGNRQLFNKEIRNSGIDGLLDKLSRRAQQ